MKPRSGKREKYPAEFKLEAVELMRAGTKEVTQIARELGVPRQYLHAWFRQAQKSSAQNPSDVFPGNGNLSPAEAELARLRKELAQAKEDNRDLKKSDGLLRQKYPLRYRFIDAHRRWYSIVALCRNLEVSKAGYYAWRGRRSSPRSLADEQLSTQIVSIHQRSKRRYGSPRVHAELRSKGVRTARKRVARLMKCQGLQGKKTRRFRVVTTDSQHGYPVAPNVLNRQFAPSAPNRAWAADITYFPTKGGWLYLAIVIDLYSRRIVGWSMSTFIDADLVLAALRMAIETRQPERGLVLHTDRGSQYACRIYRNFIAAREIVASMSRKRNCWDNAVAESFFASMKVELDDGRLLARSEARSAIFEYIEAWYNRERRHSTIGFLSPMEFEERRRRVA